MHLFKAVLMFAAAVSALDIRLHRNQACNNAYVACSNVRSSVYELNV